MTSLVPLLTAVAVVGRLHVLPPPKRVEELGGRVRFSSPVTVWVARAHAHDDDARFAAEELVRAIAALGEQAGMDVGQPAGRGWFFIGDPTQDEAIARASQARSLKLTDAMAAEGYALSVDDEGVVLVARTPAGLFYGVQTLAQVMRGRGRGIELPRVRIHDWPVMRLRGIMHDTSRGQVPTVETAMRIIDFCARYKLNFYSPYIEHTFAWEGHEDIWRGSGAWTAREFAQLAAYARPRNVMIIPQFEAMGHQTHILTKDRYKHLAETRGWSFAPAVDETYELLDDLMGQMSRAFPFHAYFGIGCDEVYDMGKGRSKELMQKLGGKGQLFAYHIKRLAEILRGYGRRPMMWGDMMLHHPETMGLVPRDVIVLDWHYGAAARYPSVKKFTDAGYEVVVCPALSSWVRIFPDYVNAFANIQNLIAEGQRNGAIGAMACNWGDWGAENLVDYNWMGWAWAAWCSWAEAEKADRDRFAADFCRTFYGMASTALAMAQWKLAQANRSFPWGGYSLRHFHADPFSKAMIHSWPSSRRAARLGAIVRQAEELLAEGHKRARLHRETIAFLHHPVRRYWYVVHRAQAIPKACEAYVAAWQAASDPQRRATELRRCLAVLRALRAELAAVRDDFRTLWLSANRPEGLDWNIRKFDAQLKAYDTRIAAVEGALQGGPLQAPEKLGLTIRGRIQGVPVKRAGVSVSAPWWDERWPYRVPVRIEAGERKRPPMPIVLRLNVARLCGVEVEPASPRLVVGEKVCPAQVVPLWSTEGWRPGEGVAFVLPHALAPGQSIEGYLYWSSGEGRVPEAESDLRVTARADRAWLEPVVVAAAGQAAEAAARERVPQEALSRPERLRRLVGREALCLEGGEVWIENSRLRVMIGSEGAHLYVWQVKALNNLDITQPGTHDWCGFLDFNWVRRTPFALRIVSAGPVVAIVHAVEPSGTEKCIAAYSGLPLVEMFSSEASGWMWNYDNVGNFAGDAPMPGRARLADGTEAAVPRSDEQVHIMPAKRVRWGAKYRPDGLTLGLITPAAPTDMRIGPGDGWGGIGIERSAATDWFVTYCDVTQGTWRSVAELGEALVPDKAIRVVVGQLQKR